MTSSLRFSGSLQLLRGVTISNGGVLPRIHPELLSKKRGNRVKVDAQVVVPEKREARSKSAKKPAVKKGKGKPGRKPRVSLTSRGSKRNRMGGGESSDLTFHFTLVVVLRFYLYTQYFRFADTVALQRYPVVYPPEAH